MNKRLLWDCSVCFFIAFAVMGCSKKDPVEQPTSGGTVTLKIYDWGWFTDETFQRLVIEPVKKKHPNISLNRVNRDIDTEPASLITGIRQMDMILISNDVLSQFEPFHLMADLTPLIKKYDIDLNRFEATNLQSIREGFDQNLLFGLPFGYDFYATFYNKYIFDKFGVDYPKDGMLWDDAIELGKKLTRFSDGLPYQGLEIEGFEKLSSSLSLPFVDPKTNKTSADIEGWRTVFDTAKRAYDASNRRPTASHGNLIKRFATDRNVAMLATNDVLGTLEKTKDLDWDIAQYPSFPERPNTFGMVKSAVMSLIATSKYPDQVMQVMQVLTSDEVQLELAKSALLVPALSNNKMMLEHFGESKPYLKNKRSGSIFKSRPAPFVAQPVYAGKVRAVFNKKYQEYIRGKDINSTIREINAEGDKLIEASK